MGKEAISPITAAEAQVALRRLEYIISALPELVDWFAANPDQQQLWCFRVASLDEGIRRLEAFVPEMRKAMLAHARGSTQGPDSTKTRKKKSAESMLYTAIKKTTANRKKPKSS